MYFCFSKSKFYFKHIFLQSYPFLFLSAKPSRIVWKLRQDAIPTTDTCENVFKVVIWTCPDLPRPVQEDKPLSAKQAFPSFFFFEKLHISVFVNKFLIFLIRSCVFLNFWFLENHEFHWTSLCFLKAHVFYQTILCCSKKICVLLAKRRQVLTDKPHSFIYQSLCLLFFIYTFLN